MGSFTVTVRDTTAPAVPTPLAAQTLQAGPTGTAVLPDYTATVKGLATDAVGVTNVTQSQTAGTVLGLGTYTLTFTVSDAAKNTTTTQTMVTVMFQRPASEAAVTVSATGTGSAAPGAGSPDGPPAGTTLSGFGAPAMSDFRELAARVTITSGRLKLGGIYTEDGAGVASLLAYQGGLTGISNLTYLKLFDPLIAPDGTIAFLSSLDHTGVANDYAVWMMPPGGTNAMVLRTGAPIPALLNAEPKSFLGLSVRNGELLALVQLIHGRGLTSANDIALVRVSGSGTNPTRLLRKGDAIAVGSAPATTITSFSVFSPALGSPGQGRWDGGGEAVVKLSLRDKRSVIEEIDSTGTPTVLGVTGGASGFSDGSKWSGFGLPAIDSTGQRVAVAAALAASAGGVSKANQAALAFSENGAVLAGLLRQGDSAPGAESVQWASFFDPIVNDQGDIAFLATVKGAGVTKANQTGLWWGTPATPVLLARLGAATVPDATGTIVAGRTWVSFVSYALPDGPSAGPVFIAKIKGTGVTSKNYLAVYAVDSQGVLRELLRSGDPMGEKMVASFTLLNAVPGAYSVTRSTNATGSVALAATFRSLVSRSASRRNASLAVTFVGPDTREPRKYFVMELR
jgi:hypothetical protein